MILNYFERLNQFAILNDSRYQPINLRFPEIKREYEKIIKSIVKSKPIRKNEKKHIKKR